MTNQPSPEEMSRRYQEYTRQQREMEIKKERIKRLVTGTDGHDRRTCDCEGCMWWWRLSIVLNENGQFMEVLPNIKFLIKKKGIDLYMRSYIHRVNLREATGREPIWIAYNRATNRKLVYNEI